MSQLVIRFVDLVGQNVKLDGHDHVNENVVLGLGLNLDIQLLNAEVQSAGDLIHHRNSHVQAGLSNGHKAAKAFNNGGRLLVDGEKRKNHQDNSQEPKSDEDISKLFVHGMPSLCRRPN